MKRTLLALIFTAALFPAPVLAQTREQPVEVQSGDLVMKGAFIRATLPRAPTAAGYVTITNTGSSDDRLMAVSSPVAKRVVVHETTQKNGVMSMRSLPDGLVIPAGTTVSLAPGESHIMLMGLDAPLSVGQTLDMTLRFEQAQDVIVRFDVLALNARRHPDMETSDGDQK